MRLGDRRSPRQGVKRIEWNGVKLGTEVIGTQDIIAVDLISPLLSLSFSCPFREEARFTHVGS